MSTLLAIAGIPQMLIYFIVIAGCIGIALVILKVSEIQIPAWAWKIFWIVLVVIVGVVAIKFLASML